MRKYLFIFLSIAVFSTHIQAEEKSGDEFLLGIMAVSKMTGMCGLFKQMAQFQEDTGMPGGDDFVLRFMSTEAARLGRTVVSFAEQCVEITAKYGAYVRAFDREQ